MRLAIHSRMEKKIIFSSLLLGLLCFSHATNQTVAITSTTASMETTTASTTITTETTTTPTTTTTETTTASTTITTETTTTPTTTASTTTTTETTTTPTTTTTETTTTPTTTTTETTTTPTTTTTEATTTPTTTTTETTTTPTTTTTETTTTPTTTTTETTTTSTTITTETTTTPTTTTTETTTTPTTTTTETTTTPTTITTETTTTPTTTTTETTTTPTTTTTETTTTPTTTTTETTTTPTTTTTETTTTPTTTTTETTTTSTTITTETITTPTTTTTETTTTPTTTTTETTTTPTTITTETTTTPTTTTTETTTTPTTTTTETTTTTTLTTPTISPTTNADTTRNETTSSSTVTTTETTGTTSTAGTVKKCAEGNVCKSSLATCVDQYEGYVCECPYGFYYSEEGTCNSGAPFPGKFTLKIQDEKCDYSIKTSKCYKDLYTKITSLCEKAFMNEMSYKETIVTNIRSQTSRIKRAVRNAEVNVAVDFINVFLKNTTVNTATVLNTLIASIPDITNVTEVKPCDAYNCDEETSMCVQEDVFVMCKCKENYYKQDPFQKKCEKIEQNIPESDGQAKDDLFIPMIVVSVVGGVLIVSLAIGLAVVTVRNKKDDDDEEEEEERSLHKKTFQGNANFSFQNPMMSLNSETPSVNSVTNSVTSPNPYVYKASDPKKFNEDDDDEDGVEFVNFRNTNNMGQRKNAINSNITANPYAFPRVQASKRPVMAPGSQNNKTSNDNPYLPQRDYLEYNKNSGPGIEMNSLNRGYPPPVNYRYNGHMKY